MRPRLLALGLFGLIACDPISTLHGRVVATATPTPVAGAKVVYTCGGYRWETEFKRANLAFREASRPSSVYCVE